MRLHEILTLYKTHSIKDKSGGIVNYDESLGRVFCDIKQRTVTTGGEIAGAPVTEAVLSITIRAENLQRLRDASKIQYKQIDLYFDSLPKFTPFKDKFITLNAKFQSTVKY